MVPGGAVVAGGGADVVAGGGAGVVVAGGGAVVLAGGGAGVVVVAVGGAVPEAGLEDELPPPPHPVSVKNKTEKPRTGPSRVAFMSFSPVASLLLRHTERIRIRPQRLVSPTQAVTL